MVFVHHELQWLSGVGLAPELPVSWQSGCQQGPQASEALAKDPCPRQGTHMAVS